jgi:hypothetical protein
LSQEAAAFDAKHADVARAVAASLVGAYDFTPFRTIVDVGGGTGGLLVGILKAHDYLHGILLDRPNVAERARERIEAHGLSDRCQVVGGDFFRKVPRGGDVYVLKHVIHDWPDSEARSILSSCSNAMRPKARLLVVEEVYPSIIDETIGSRQAATNDLNLLVCFGGAERSEAHLAALLESAGLRLDRVVQLDTRLRVVDSVKP